MNAAALALAVMSTLAQGQGRPQLSEAEAARHTVADYLGDWAPSNIDVSQADFIVVQDGSGTHASLQAALDAVPEAASRPGRRFVIEMRPGTYREQICVRGRAPITLRGSGPGVLIVGSHYNGQAKRPDEPANPCAPNLGAASYGTAGSASVAIFSDDFQAAHLSIANDAMDGVRGDQGYPPMASNSGGAQAVALMTEGDRLQFDDVRLIGHQDTFYVRGPGRVQVTRSLIAGDVDFIFGNARLVITHSTVQSRAGRRGGGPVLAPSTGAEAAFGFLVINSRFTAEPGLPPGSAPLGRAWDAGVAPGTYVPGRSPNGQALVRDSELGAHIGPWAASTSRRPFAASGELFNRLSEYRNEAPPIMGGQCK